MDLLVKVRKTEVLSTEKKKEPGLEKPSKSLPDDALDQQRALSFCILSGLQPQTPLLFFILPPLPSPKD